MPRESRVKARLHQDGHGHVEVSFAKPLGVEAMLDLLRLCGRSLFVTPTLFLTFEGDPVSRLRDDDHFMEILSDPPSDLPTYEAAIGEAEGDDLVLIDLDGSRAWVGLDDPSRHAERFLSLLKETSGAWRGLASDCRMEIKRTPR